MKKKILPFIFGLIFISLSAQDYTLVWSDEFDVDGAPSEEFWSYENGFVRNDELQCYQKDNVY